MKWGLVLGLVVGAAAATGGEAVKASAMSKGTKLAAEGLARATEKRRMMQGEGEIDVDLIVGLLSPCLDAFGLTPFVRCIVTIDPDLIDDQSDATDGAEEVLEPLITDPTSATLADCGVVFTAQPTTQCLGALPSVTALEEFTLAANQSFVDQQPACAIFAPGGEGGDSVAGSLSESDSDSDTDSTTEISTGPGTSVNLTADELFTAFGELKDHCETLSPGITTAAFSAASSLGPVAVFITAMIAVNFF